MAHNQNSPDGDWLRSQNVAGSCSELRLFLFARDSFVRRIGSNWVACWKTPRTDFSRWAFAPMFRSSYLPRKRPTRSLLASGLLHIGLIAWLMNLPQLPQRLPHAETNVLSKQERTILWYPKSDLLPPVSPLKTEEARERPQAEPPFPRRTAPPTRAVQTIVSRPPRPDNQRQRILLPDLPDVHIRAEIQIPNIVVIKPKLAPPMPAAPEAQRLVTEIHLPNLPPPALPVLPVPPPSQIEVLKRKLAEIPVPETTVVPTPKLEVPYPSTPVALIPRAAPKEAVQKTSPPAPAPPAVQTEIRTEGLLSLIAVGIAPAPPTEDILSPPGNRAGEFATSPQGVERPPGVSQADGTDPASGETASLGVGQQELADLRAPQLSISGNQPATESALVGAPAPTRSLPSAASPDMAQLLAKASRPTLLSSLPRGTPLEPENFGGRHVYTLHINMPNLSSASGSWVLRFAELDGEGARNQNKISSPMAVRKVDPQYEPSAIRERVEGIVILAAQILRDGSVANIRVVNSLDPRLDLSAIQAFTRWQFEPAKRNGTAVDLDVLVQIPFRLPAL
ncbi:MAG: energy transducer TonB [Acidobacteria bacterium]|nr:energy transducer TonB [Acidobacteriota bacterium]